VRRPLTAAAVACVHTLCARYRCRLCRSIVTVIPRGAARARHFSATAIALACVMYGLSGGQSSGDAGAGRAVALV
jgi:hypothetical protein